LADLAEAINRVSPDLRYFLVGASARDLLLEHAHNIDPGRNTNDVDLALTVDNWAEFEQMRLRLIEGGQFAPIGNLAHTLLFEGRYELDLVPFGDVEQEDRTIAWPPNGSVVMNVFGFATTWMRATWSAWLKKPRLCWMHRISTMKKQVPGCWATIWRNCCPIRLVSA